VTTGLKLALYGLVLAAMVAVGAAVGAAVGPIDIGDGDGDEHGVWTVELAPLPAGADRALEVER
jgi:hypothetical protein